MVEWQADSSEKTPDTRPYPPDAQVVREVQHSLARWITSGAGQDELANAHDKTLPLPVMLLHLYRDLARFYERRLGMSQSRVMLLHELMHTGEIHQTELAQHLGMETALVTRFVKQMEASGLLCRRVDPLDNRFTLVMLTPAGQEVFEQMMIFSREFEARLIEGLDKDEHIDIKQALSHIQRQLSSLKRAAAEESNNHPEEQRRQMDHA